MFKQQKGITLVALVITIIVLLILAGVSISLVVGQNGVLTRATNAVSSNKASTAKQAVSMALSSVEMEYYTAWTQNQSTTRSQYYTDTALLTEIKNQGYNTTSTVCSVTGSIIKEDGSMVTFTLVNTSGDQIKVNVNVKANGELTWGDIQIYDSNSSGYVTVTGI
jgi:Tfp pilus assembly major pilin PilA